MIMNIVPCLVFLAYAGLSMSDDLDDEHNIVCQPVATVVKVNDNYEPYFVLLHRCQGSVLNYRPSRKICAMKSSTTVTITYGGESKEEKNHTSCIGMCAFHAGSTEDLFTCNENTCLCSCKHDKAPNGCPGNAKWNKVKCKCDCELGEPPLGSSKILDHKKCKYVCPPSTCKSGFTMHEEKCICTETPQAVGRSRASGNSNQATLFVAVVAVEFAFLYLIFDAILYSKKTGLLYYIKCKCLKSREEPAHGEPETKKCLENGANETNV